MAGISGIGSVGPGLQGVRLAAEFQAAGLRIQKQAIQLQGNLALQLIQSATVTDPHVATKLDVSV